MRLSLKSCSGQVSWQRLQNQYRKEITRDLLTRTGNNDGPKGQDNERGSADSLHAVRAANVEAEIAPFGGGPGLVALMCTECGTTDRVLVHQAPKATRSRVLDRTAAMSN
jgi:hypothetical protein